MPSTESPMGQWPISFCSTLRPIPSNSSGTYSTWPMPPLLPGLRDFCMIPCWGDAPQKRPDPSHNRTRGAVGARSGAALRVNTMSQSRWTTQLQRAVSAGALAAAVLATVAAGPAHAADDDDDSIWNLDRKIFRQSMKALGLKSPL